MTLTQLELTLIQVDNQINRILDQLQRDTFNITLQMELAKLQTRKADLEEEIDALYPY